MHWIATSSCHTAPSIQLTGVHALDTFPSRSTLSVREMCANAPAVHRIMGAHCSARRSADRVKPYSQRLTLKC